ncbi:hypothetical protein [Sphaerisporangium corydalis]|uniref:Polymerase nucleotidyl transferase domain-containing protein n=1 Tax=Sphaerisporangium corydalis TaxID=1441875 RepID=A0ABV9EDF2_9ACTN|nr:hypothetical protein [Sphaerisporangium corydalis]
MRVREARGVAGRWVGEFAAGAAGFAGAFFSGSVCWGSGERELAAASDVDVIVMTSGDRAPDKLGKFVWGGVLIEATYLSWGEMPSPGEMAGSYHLAGSFRGVGGIIADPTGRLAEIQARTAREFARRPWVRRRCADAEKRIVDGLGRLDPSEPFHDQVTSWLFPTGVTTHVLLTAGLRNPTVRLRYVAAGELLAEYGQADFYEELLRLLGCANLSPERVTRHLQAMAEVFDATAPLSTTPFFFSSDITPLARPIAVDGAHDLIARGRHREAVFWIAATYARCLKILTADAPPTVRKAFAGGFAHLIADLGITSPADLQSRAQDVLTFLPALRTTTNKIITTNPHIQD